MRQIDGDALKEVFIQTLENIKSNPRMTGQEMHIITAIHTVGQMIDDASTIDAEPRWIPVSERLPEIKEHYVSDVCLVCLKDHGMTFAELQENIFGQVGWDVEREDDYHESKEVVAWMPLPEPYKEENHE